MPENLMRVGQDVGEIESPAIDAAGLGLQQQADGAAEVAAVDFGPGAGGNGLPGKIIGEKPVPFVWTEVAIDAGRSEACRRKARDGEREERMLGIALYFAIKRVRRRFVCLRQHLAGRPVAIDGA
jgi:hypothetical protein